MSDRPHAGAGLLARLDELTHRLKSAGARFDQGTPVAAQAMAVDVSELIHHTGNSPALLHRLGLHRELTWVDTAGVTHPKTVTSAACLTLMKIGSGPDRHGEYVPKLDLYPPVPIRTRDGGRIDRGSRIPFDHWWTNPVVKDPEGVEYSRKQLVLALAHQQTGIRDDPEVAAAYGEVSGSDWLGWVLRRGAAAESPTFRTNPLLASVRQIGYEVVQTVAQQRDLIETTRAPALVSLPPVTALIPDGPVPSLP